jgi:hypothetical protein
MSFALLARIATAATMAFPLLLAPKYALAQQQPMPCLRYEPDTVAVEGKLVRRTYPGPPNYESVQQGDRPETGYYLELVAPTCVGRGADSLLDPAHASITAIQLVLDSAGYARLRPRLGTVVRLEGTLFGAYSGHHHTEVLLGVVWRAPPSPDEETSAAPSARSNRRLKLPGAPPGGRYEWQASSRTRSLTRRTGWCTLAPAA